jgi:hypothetical protein
MSFGKSRIVRLLRATAIIAFPAVLLNASLASATTLDFTQSSQFLLIGTGPSSTAIAAKTSNYELGANQAPVPATSPWGPSLQGNVPNLPGGIQPVPTGVQNNGEIAVTNPIGQFDFANVGLYAVTGVQCASSADACAKSTSNTAFNQPNYPNQQSPFAPTSFNSSFQLAPGNGVTGNVNFAALTAELAVAAATIPGLLATQTQDLNSGSVNSPLITNLVAGLNVIDLVATSDFDISDNWVIQGDPTSFAIFRIPDGKNFKISQGNILAGSTLGGLDRIMFYSLNDDTGEHFNFNQTVINGVAFWNLYGGLININDAQGCTQLVSPEINLNNVRLSRCAPMAVPLHPSVPVHAIGLGLLAFWWWRHRRQAAA